MEPPNLTRRGFLGSSLAACSLPGLARAGEEGVSKEVPWLAGVQTPPEVLPPDAPKLSSLLVDENGRKITTLAAWQKRRAQIRRWWLDFLGRLKVERKGREKGTGPFCRNGPEGASHKRVLSPCPERKETPPIQVVKEDRPGGAIRQLVRYEVEPGRPAEAYLLKPEKQQGPAPGVVVLHSTVNHTIRQGAGVEGRPEKAFGLKLARRGCVTICPRCFLWPNDLEPPEEKKLSYNQRVDRFHGRHPGCRGMAKMLYDAVVALDVLAGMPEVDAKRLGAVGHSLGAKEVLYLAAFDERVKATVSSEGGVGTRFSNWDAPWYLDKEIRRPDFAHEHHELLALVAPRAFLLLGGNSADGDRSWPFIKAALPVYRLYGGTPRLGLFNHKKGHSVPPEAERRIDEWFQTYL